MKHNPENVRMKRKYFTYLQDAKQKAGASVDAAAKAISRFEDYTKHRSFKSYHFEQAVGFKKHLLKQTSKKTGKPLSKSTLKNTCQNLKDFFQWLTMQPGYASKIKYTDIEYFNLSEKDTRVAGAKRPKRVPTIEQIKHVIGVMPSTTDVEKRDRCLIAFTLLTGARDAAIASMKLKNIDLQKRKVFQDARNVKTKFSKTFETYFFPVGEEIVLIVENWVRHLREDLLFGPDDPLFPKTLVVQGEERVFATKGITKEHWSNAGPIRRIFREAFERAELQYFNPHSFRDALVNLGYQLCRTPEDMKAWSQNIGHQSVSTTLYSYGEVQPNRQAELFASFGNRLNSDTKTVKERLAEFLNEL